MEKKQRKTLSERIVDAFIEAEEKEARTKVIDLRHLVRKNPKMMN